MVQQTAVVDTKSPLSSKVNWILLLTGLLDTANEILPLIPEQYRHSATLYVTAAGLILGIITKTFFTTTISSTSLPASAPTSVVVHTDAEERAETESLNVTQAALARVK
jgi:hypothetical protein